MACYGDSSTLLLLPRDMKLTPEVMRHMFKHPVYQKIFPRFLFSQIMSIGELHGYLCDSRFQGLWLINSLLLLLYFN
jgi:hypothetical protein